MNTIENEVENEVVAPDLDLTELGDPDGDFNAQPAPVPEGQKYIVALGLGRQGIAHPTYKDKVTGETKSFYTLDMLARFVQSEDGATDLAFFQGVAPVKDSQGNNLSSFVPKGKTISGILFIAQLAGLNVRDFDSTNELITTLERTLRGTEKPQALATRIQWQWYSKDIEWTDKKEKARKGKVVQYGMSKAEKLADGTFNPVLEYTHTDGHTEKITARAVILELAPLA